LAATIQHAPRHAPGVGAALVLGDVDVEGLVALAGEDVALVCLAGLSMVEPPLVERSPDVTIVCGPQATAAQDPHALTNPSVLVEVTSRSTEDYDRGDKLSHYKQLPSLQAVLFVSHHTPRVTLVQRSATDWSEREFRAGVQARRAHLRAEPRGRDVSAWQSSGVSRRALSHVARPRAVRGAGGSTPAQGRPRRHRCGQSNRPRRARVQDKRA